jgi:hypothetical protein
MIDLDRLRVLAECGDPEASDRYFRERERRELNEPWDGLFVGPLPFWIALETLSDGGSSVARYNDARQIYAATIRIHPIERAPEIDLPRVFELLRLEDASTGCVRNRHIDDLVRDASVWWNWRFINQKHKEDSGRSGALSYFSSLHSDHSKEMFLQKKREPWRHHRGSRRSR